EMADIVLVKTRRFLEKIIERADVFRRHAGFLPQRFDQRRMRTGVIEDLAQAIFLQLAQLLARHGLDILIEVARIEITHQQIPYRLVKRLKFKFLCGLRSASFASVDGSAGK